VSKTTIMAGKDSTKKTKKAENKSESSSSSSSSKGISSNEQQSQQPTPRNAAVAGDGDGHHYPTRIVSRIRIILVGLFLVIVGTVGFYTIPGAIVPQATGSKLINAFYCSVMTLTT
jgi:hypothetical protein